MTKGARFHLNYIKKLKPCLPPTDFKMPVQSLVISSLEFGCTTLAGDGAERHLRLPSDHTPGARQESHTGPEKNTGFGSITPRGDIYGSGRFDVEAFINPNCTAESLDTARMKESKLFLICKFITVH